MTPQKTHNVASVYTAVLTTVCAALLSICCYFLIHWHNQTDDYGKAIQQLQSGLSLQQIGIPDVSIVEKNHLQPMLSDNWIEGQIIFIDNFENIIVNITREQFEQQRKSRNFRIVFKRDEVIDRISEIYPHVPEGAKLPLFHAAG